MKGECMMKIVPINVSTGFISGRDKIIEHSESDSVSIDGTIPSMLSDEDRKILSDHRIREKVMLRFFLDNDLI